MRVDNFEGRKWTNCLFLSHLGRQVKYYCNIDMHSAISVLVDVGPRISLIIIIFVSYKKLIMVNNCWSVIYFRGFLLLHILLM